MIFEERSMLLRAIVAMVMIYLLFPLVVVVTISFSASSHLSFPPEGYSLRWYGQIVSDTGWIRAFMLTLQVGLLSSVIAVLAGVPAAWALSRNEFFGKKLTGIVILSALVMPPIVKAISIYLFYRQLGLINTVLGLSIAHATGGLAFVVINVMAALKGFDRTIERAAVIHGAHPLVAVTGVTLRIIAPSILVGGIFAFMASAQELLVSIFVLGTVSKPVSVKLWESAQVAVDPSVAAASSALIGVAILGLIAAALLRRGIRTTRQGEGAHAT